MNEITTSALVLDSKQTGEYDGRVTLFTQSGGKIIARARSLYKANGKLAAHLQPLTIVQVRLVEKKGIQIVDALAQQRLITPATTPAQAVQLLSVARLITELTQPQQPDQDLWNLIATGRLMSRELLAVLGFDPEHASCDRCQKKQPSHFLLREAVYVCKDCFGAIRAPASVVI